MDLKNPKIIRYHRRLLDSGDVIYVCSEAVGEFTVVTEDRILDVLTHFGSIGIKVEMIAGFDEFNMPTDTYGEDL